MKINHKHFIDLAFQLAEKNLGLTGLNPSVGCVVVKNNKIISTGVTAKNGRFPDGTIFPGPHILRYTQPFLMIPGWFESWE